MSQQAVAPARSNRRFEFSPSLVHVAFLENKISLWQVFIRVQLFAL